VGSVAAVTKRATCPKRGRRDAEDITGFEDGVRKELCEQYGQQPPEAPKH
jgi:hypothetical protein